LVTRTSRRVIKLLCGVVLGFVMCEALLRFWPRSLLPKEFRILDRVYSARSAWEDMMMGDPYLGYKLKPNLDILFPSEGRKIPYRTTSYGLGDIGFRDIGTHPPFSAVAVGDSFTLCDDVPAAACWVRHLADADGLSTATLGVNGYSTLAEARILERYAPPLRPRLVLLGEYPNDFKDNVNFDRWTRSDTDNFWIWLGHQRGRGRLGRWLADHSMIYRTIDGAWRARGRQIYKYKQGNFDFVFRLDRWWLQLAKNAEHDPGWRLMQKAILDMRATATKMGADFVVLIFPTKEQIYWVLARQFAPGKEDLNVDHPTDVVREFCEANAIKYCEFAGPLREEAQRGRQLYHRISGHWNDEGNALGAQVIARCLGNYGLLKGAAESAAVRE
jgi:hypothetical protein